MGDHEPTPTFSSTDLQRTVGVTGLVVVICRLVSSFGELVAYAESGDSKKFSESAFNWIVCSFAAKDPFPLCLFLAIFPISTVSVQ